MWVEGDLLYKRHTSNYETIKKLDAMQILVDPKKRTPLLVYKGQISAKWIKPWAYFFFIAGNLEL